MLNTCDPSVCSDNSLSTVLTLLSDHTTAHYRLATPSFVSMWSPKEGVACHHCAVQSRSSPRICLPLLSLECSAVLCWSSAGPLLSPLATPSFVARPDIDESSTPSFDIEGKESYGTKEGVEVFLRSFNLYF